MLDEEVEGTTAKSPKSEPDSTELAQAMEIRREWMRLMRLDEDEIEASCREEPPTSLEAEMEHLRAAKLLPMITPSREVLSRQAINY